MLFESTLAAPFSRQIKQKLQYPVRILESLVGAGGFEPPKLKAADLQSVPIGHSGTRPYSVVVHPCAGRLVYFSMRKGFCQPPFFTFFQQAHSPLPAALHPGSRICLTSSFYSNGSSENQSSISCPRLRFRCCTFMVRSCLGARIFSRKPRTSSGARWRASR